MNSIWLALVTGATSGGISCLAVQGGLLASAISKSTDNDKSKFTDRLLPVGTFLVSKLIAYMLMGTVLGFAGSLILLTPKMIGFAQIAAGIFMILTALRMLDVHPVFRYFALTPPRAVFKLMRRVSKSENLFAPFILGFLTIFVPCGITQAMMVLAVSSGNALNGSLIMGAFVLGTSPVFMVLGAAMTELLKKQAFVYAACGLIIIFAIMSINGGIVATGSVYSLQNFYKAATTDIKASDRTVAGLPPVNGTGQQEVTINVSTHGYASDYEILKTGVPVKLTLKTQGVQSCARAFTIPEYNIQKILPETGETVVEFTPEKSGRLAYSCSMGMYTGSFTVR